MIKSKYFTQSELIEPTILEILRPSLCARLIKPDVVDRLDGLREEYERRVRFLIPNFKPMDYFIFINGDYCGQTFKYSGVRSKHCPEGAMHSAHKNGYAFDLKCLHLELLLDIILGMNFILGITRIENPEITVSRGWIHVEFGEIITEKLSIFP